MGLFYDSDFFHQLDFFKMPALRYVATYMTGIIPIHNFLSIHNFQTKYKFEKTTMYELEVRAPIFDDII